MLIRHSQFYLFLQGISGIGLNRILDIWHLQGEDQPPKREIHTNAHIYPVSYFLFFFY